MHSKVIAFNKEQRAKEFSFRSGDVVKVHRKIKEGNKERIQIFEGMIIAIKGRQSSSQTITVRKVSTGSYGVEIVVPVISPFIEKIELVKRAKVRRSKLYYVRDKAAKALRFKFTDSKDVAMPVFAAAAAEEEAQAQQEQEDAQKATEKEEAEDTTPDSTDTKTEEKAEPSKAAEDATAEKEGEKKE